MRKGSRKRLGMVALMTPDRGAFVPVKYVRLITTNEGEGMVRRGSANRLVDVETERVVGYQLVAASAKPKLPAPIWGPRSSPVSSTAFSKSEHEAIVGLRGASQTYGLSDEARKSRVAAGFPDEDFVECARQKFESYRHVH